MADFSRSMLLSSFRASGRKWAKDKDDSRRRLSILMRHSQQTDFPSFAAWIDSLPRSKDEDTFAILRSDFAALDDADSRRLFAEGVVEFFESLQSSESHA